jgi:chitinase
MHLDGASEDAAEATAFGFGEEDDPSIVTEGAKPNAYMVHNEDGGTQDGQVQFRGLVDQKVLQYLSAWSTPTRAVVTTVSNESSVNQDTKDDNYSQHLSSANGTNAGVSIPDDPSDNIDNSSQQSSDQPDGTDNSQVGLTSIAFAGQQIINVFNGLNGFVREWDACSSTPFLHSTAARQVITYDDPQSLEMKAVFVRAAGMLGVNMFDIHGDTDRWDLTDALRRGLGL